MMLKTTVQLMNPDQADADGDGIMMLVTTVQNIAVKKIQMAMV
jgi:hypothetical protein